MKSTPRAEAFPASALMTAGLLFVLFAPGAAAADWQVEIVDHSGTGRFSSLKIDRDGNTHVSYIADDGDRSLKYAFWDRSLKQWFVMTVDKHASFSSLVLDSRRYPHISYVEDGAVLGSKLRYAYWDGRAWKRQVVQLSTGGVAYYTSIALDKQDRPIISFYDHLDPESNFVLRLRTVSWDGSSWEERTVDNEMGSGKFNSIATDSAGHPAIAYANVRYMSAGLRYAHWNGNSWDIEVLEGADGSHPVYSVAMILDNKDVPHITYTDLTNRSVKYATRRDGVWKIEIVGSVVKEAYPDRNGIALDGAGNPYITYYDAGPGVLRLAYRKGSKWTAEVVDRNSAGFTNSVQFDGGSVWVTYADEGTGVLKVARTSIPDTDSAQGGSFSSRPAR